MQQGADSLERMLLHLSRLSPDPVYYRGERIGQTPKSHVIIGDSFFRRFSCSLNCGACCDVNITLDYRQLDNIHPDYRNMFEKRIVEVNSRKLKIYTCTSRQHSFDNSCFFLTRDDDPDDPEPRGPLGPCLLWDKPYSPPCECIRAPQIQVLMHQKGYSMLLKKPFGRAWRYPRTPQCKFEATNSVEVMGLQTDIDRLFALYQWADYFRIQTALPMIVAHLRGVIAGDHPPGRKEILLPKASPQLKLF